MLIVESLERSETNRSAGRNLKDRSPRFNRDYRLLHSPCRQKHLIQAQSPLLGIFANICDEMWNVWTKVTIKDFGEELRKSTIELNGGLSTTNLIYMSNAVAKPFLSPPVKDNFR